MFTGIVEEVGSVKKISVKAGLSVLEVEACKTLEGTGIGDSIAVNGVCLTVTGKNKNSLRFDVMRQTLSRTNLKVLPVGHKVNLERSLAGNGRISGHFVYGHVDLVSPVLGIKKEMGRSYIDIALKKENQKYVVPKGSIAIDGISLTIGEVSSDRIRIFLIPHTWGNTTLTHKKTGDPVNVEFDMLAKYVHKQNTQKQGITKGFLRGMGF